MAETSYELRIETSADLAGLDEAQKHFLGLSDTLEEIKESSEAVASAVNEVGSAAEETAEKVEALAEASDEWSPEEDAERWKEAFSDVKSGAEEATEAVTDTGDEAAESAAHGTAGLEQMRKKLAEQVPFANEAADALKMIGVSAPWMIILTGAAAAAIKLWEMKRAAEDLQGELEREAEYAKKVEAQRVKDTEARLASLEKIKDGWEAAREALERFNQEADFEADIAERQAKAQDQLTKARILSDPELSTEQKQAAIAGVDQAAKTRQEDAKIAELQRDVEKAAGTKDQALSNFTELSEKEEGQKQLIERLTKIEGLTDVNSSDSTRLAELEADAGNRAQLLELSTDSDEYRKIEEKLGVPSLRDQITARNTQIAELRSQSGNAVLGDGKTAGATFELSKISEKREAAEEALRKARENQEKIEREAQMEADTVRLERSASEALPAAQATAATQAQQSLARQALMDTQGEQDYLAMMEAGISPTADQFVGMAERLEMATGQSMEQMVEAVRNAADAAVASGRAATEANAYTAQVKQMVDEMAAQARNALPPAGGGASL